MTSAKPSKRAKSAGRSNASPGAAEVRRPKGAGARIIDDVAARVGDACDMLGVPDGRVVIVVACSGGTDSAAALHALRRARPSARLYACYVDHRVRPRASIARDREAVRAQALESGAEVRLLRTSGAIPKGVSVEAVLRAQRYRLLTAFARKAGARFVVTGHQRDDVAESTLLALMRGSGVDGVAAMAPRRPLDAGVEVIRPLLWAPKRLLAAYAHAAGLALSEDETNDDVRIRRNAVRRLLRDLEAIAPGASRAIARSAAIASDDKALLAAVADAAWRSARSADGASLYQEHLRRLPIALLRRVLRLEVQRVAGSGRDLAYAHCAAIARALREHRGGVFHAGTARAVLSGRRLKIERSDGVAGKRPSRDATVIAPRARGAVEWDGGCIRLHRMKHGGNAAARTVRNANGAAAGRAV